MVGPDRSTWKIWFWHTYDYLGTLIVINLMWVGTSLLIITIPLAMAGLFHVTYKITNNEEVRILDFFAGIRKHGSRLTVLCVTIGLLLGILAVNILFYIRMIDDWSWWAAIVAGGILWLTVFVLIVSNVALPSIIQTEESVRLNLKNAVLLVLANPSLSLGLLAGSTAILSTGLLTGAGFLFVAVSGWAMLCTTVTREMRARIDGSYADDIEEARGWRDLFRPWDMGK